jgi:ABC-type sulfate transport system permease component
MRVRFFLGAVLALFLAVPTVAAAQIAVNPQAATYVSTDADHAITATIHIDYFQCSSVTPAAACVGKASAPFQSGTDVPKASITSTGAVTCPTGVPAGSTCTTHSVSLTTAPANGVLASMPSGVGFVADLKAVGDTTIPGVAGTSPYSADSNPFFARARTPAAPGLVAVQ